MFKVTETSIQMTSINKRSRELNEKFHKADEDQLPSARAMTYLVTMLPVTEGDHAYNRAGKQEWEIQRETDTQFLILGK